MTGRAALQQLLAHEGPLSDLPFQDFSGSFVVLLARPDGVWLFHDALGIGKAYEARGGGVISTSFLACMAALAQVQVDRLRAQEYVLLGATHGCETPIRGLRALDPTLLHELRDGSTTPVHAPAQQLRAPAPGRFDDAVQSTVAAVQTEFQELTRAHPGRIGMALSGGFDSRALLAALDHLGVAPQLYVYGGADSEDVRVARHVAGALGMPIRTIDKSALERERPPLDRERLRANLRFFDGLPPDGIFDRGSDQATRLMQVEGGMLNLNGGGGEILRNFFYLRDGHYSATDVQAAFYAGWLDEVFPSATDREAFLAMVPAEILRSLGRPDDSPHSPLDRREVELVYTSYRLRWWMGRNNACAARYGTFMTPLVSPRMVRHAAALPLAFKDHGRLEAAVIRALSPRVAAGPSAYGFDFGRGPSWRHRLNVHLTMYRPLFVRHHSVRVQRLLGRLKVPAAPLEWQQALGKGAGDEWLRPQALTRMDQVNRLMTLRALLEIGP